MIRFLKTGLLLILCVVAVECLVRGFFAYRFNDPQLLFYAIPLDSLGPLASITPDLRMEGYRKYSFNPRKKYMFYRMDRPL